MFRYDEAVNGKPEAHTSTHHQFGTQCNKCINSTHSGARKGDIAHTHTPALPPFKRLMPRTWAARDLQPMHYSTSWDMDQHAGCEHITTRVLGGPGTPPQSSYYRRVNTIQHTTTTSGGERLLVHSPTAAEAAAVEAGHIEECVPACVYWNV